MQLILPPLHNGLKPTPIEGPGEPIEGPGEYSGQLEVFNYLFKPGGKRTVVLVAGRRFGKTRLVVMSVLFACLSWDRPINRLSPERILVVLPTMEQAIKVMWDPLMNVFAKIPSAKINKGNHTIEIPNKPKIILSGAEAGHGMRGVRAAFACCDEFQNHRPEIFYEVIKPAMADTPGSRVLITGTPMGELNILYELAHAPESKLFQYETKDNPYISREYIEEARRTLPPRVFEQEMQGSFISFEGQIYTEWEDKYNIYEQHPDNYDRAFMGVDWGDVNPAYIILLLKDKDLYVAEAKTMGDGTNPVPQPAYFDCLVEACQRWKVHRVIAPKDRPASILELRQIGKTKNIEAMKRTIESSLRSGHIAQGIQTTHALIYQRRLRVYKGLTEFIKEIKSYRRKQHSSGKFIPDTVDPNQRDHTLDSLRIVIDTLNTSSKGKLMQA